MARRGISRRWPSVGHFAPSPFSRFTNASLSITGTFLYNIVDTTVGVVPVTFVDAVKDAFSDEWFARGKAGSKIVEKRVYGGQGGVGAVYDAKAMEGIPVGVQVVGGHWEEEKVLEMMKVVDEALGPRGFGPGKSVQNVK